MYEEIINEDGSITIKRTVEENSIWWIPANESNKDYQEYLAWKALQE